MFDSNYNANTVLPIYQTNNNHPFDDHFFNSFPSHLLDDDELFLNTILPYQPQPPPLPPPPPQQPPPLFSTAVNDDTNIGQNSDEPKKLRRKGVVKKKQEGGDSSKRKAGKKDRHSKIYTANGPRDRRMRLSLQIARKFFDLQDMLGFDKASKTIEWLFSKSRAAIKDLAEKSCTTVISPLGEVDCSDGGKNQGKLMSESRSSRKGGVNKMNEKRKQARARASERTKEKLMKNKEVLEMDENPNNTLEYNVLRVDKVHQLEDQMASVGIMEKYLAASSSMADFRHDCEEGAFSMEFMGNGDYESSGVDVGLMQELAVNSDYAYNQVEGPNCAFMDRTYNQHSRDFNY